MIVFKNAHFITMENTEDLIEEMHVKNGEIKYLGIRKELPKGATIIDCAGGFLTPGLIDIHAHVGIWGEVNESINDANEYSSPFTPLMHALDGIDFKHFSFKQALAGGVTTVQTGPGSANVIGGIWSIVKTAGKSIDEQVVVERSGLKGALGENPKNLFGNDYKQKPMTRMAIAQIIREAFSKANNLSKSEQDEVVENNEELRPFIEVLRGVMPLRLHCHRSDDILTAIRIAKEFDIKLHIEHCTEGHLVLNEVQESGYNVTLGPYLLTPSKYETRNSTPEIASIFHEQKIPFAIMTDHPFCQIQYLKYCATEAIRFGLDEITALEAITINAAKLVNLDHRIGSLKVGKDADFVIWSGHPFKTESNVISTWVNGEVYYEK